MTTTSYTVVGMTCGHCVHAVRNEIVAIDGVTNVDVDLESGRVSVESAAPIDGAVIATAVDEAGYAVVP